jgi:NADPH2:quinone reductase
VGRKEGFILGGEGTGIVIEVGKGVDRGLRGKKVSFHMGAWATHAIADPNEMIVFNDSVALDQAAAAWINPMTAMAELTMTKEHKAKAVINTAASSQLGKMFIRLCAKEGIETINLVRKDENITSLKKDYGAKYVLNTESTTFFNDLEALIKEL